SLPLNNGHALPESRTVAQCQELTRRQLIISFSVLFEASYSKLRASERGHFRTVLGTAQHCQEHDQQDLDQIVAGIFGSRIGNALERGQEKLHRRPPRIGGSPLKNPLFAALQAPSAQVKCDSPAFHPLVSFLFQNVDQIHQTFRQRIVDNVIEIHVKRLSQIASNFVSLPHARG